jgi:hypothetical protein
MTLQERLDTYKNQHNDWSGKLNEAMANVHRLGGAIAAVEDQIKEEVEAAAALVTEAATGKLPNLD